MDFPYHEQRPALIHGWARRFWQGSRDHRGTPQAPGRVVTLIPRRGERCVGLAYRVEADVLAHLDRREKDGYQRTEVDMHTPVGTRRGITYVAPTGNPGFLGPSRLDEMAADIRRAAGPSGSNRDYLRNLATALHRLGADDAHVRTLAARVAALDAGAGRGTVPAPRVDGG